MSQDGVEAVREGLLQQASVAQPAPDGTLTPHLTPAHVLSQALGTADLEGDHPHLLRVLGEPLHPARGEAEDRVVRVQGLGEEQELHAVSPASSFNPSA